MTTIEAAAYLDVTRAWLWRLIKAGTIAAEKRGRDWWIEPEEVERYQRERRPAHRPSKTPIDSQIDSIAEPAGQHKALDVSAEGFAIARSVVSREGLEPSTR